MHVQADMPVCAPDRHTRVCVCVCVRAGVGVGVHTTEGEKEGTRLRRWDGGGKKGSWCETEKSSEAYFGGQRTYIHPRVSLFAVGSIDLLDVLVDHGDLSSVQLMT